MDGMGVLLFNIPRTTLDPDACFLARGPFAVESCTQADDLNQRLDKTAYKMVILNLPSGGLEPRDILYTLRHQKHASSNAILVVFSPDDKLAEYQPCLSKGITALFSLNAPAGSTIPALSAILQVAPRVNSRLMVRLSAKLHQGASKHLCQTQNLSRTGMCVATALIPPIGSEVTVELLLPNQPAPLMGEARVARHVLGARNSPAGMGLHFISFKTDGRARLDAFLEHAAPKS